MEVFDFLIVALKIRKVFVFAHQRVYLHDVLRGAFIPPEFPFEPRQPAAVTGGRLGVRQPAAISITSTCDRCAPLPAQVRLDWRALDRYRLVEDHHGLHPPLLLVAELIQLGLGRLACEAAIREGSGLAGGRNGSVPVRVRTAVETWNDPPAPANVQEPGRGGLANGRRWGPKGVGGTIAAGRPALPESAAYRPWSAGDSG
jgi:hypothetical protein